MTQVNILRIRLLSLCNNIDWYNQIEKKLKTLKVEQYLPTTRKDATEICKSVQITLWILWKEYQSKQTILLEDQEEAYVASWPNMCPKKAAKNCKSLRNNSDIFSELRTKVHKGGGLRYNLPSFSNNNWSNTNWTNHPTTQHPPFLTSWKYSSSRIRNNQKHWF